MQSQMTTTNTDPNDLLAEDPVPLPTRPKDEPKAINTAITEWAADHFDLDLEDGMHHDARAQTGAPVRVVTAAWRNRNGTTKWGTTAYAHGRFRIDGCDHEWLRAHDGLYVFVVYERHRLGVIPLYARITFPDHVQANLLGDGDWNVTRVAWPIVFPLAEGTL